MDSLPLAFKISLCKFTSGDVILVSSLPEDARLNYIVFTFL